MKSRRFACLFVGCLCSVAACDSGGSSESSSFLEIVSFAPADGRDDVQVEIQIGLRVSERIDPSTLTDDTFFLTSPDGAVVPSTLSILDEPDADPSQVGTGALLVPDAPLDVITGYTVTVTTGLSSVGGKSLAEDFDWSFFTIDAAWGEAEWIEAMTPAASTGYQIGVDEDLNAVAVWTVDQDDAGSAIYANRYTRVDLWATEEQLSDGTADAVNPSLAVDAAGNAFAVWERSTSATDTRIWASIYDVGTGQWGESALLQNGDVTRARLPAVAADASGNAIAIWMQADEALGRDVVRAIRYEPGAGWGDAETIGTPQFTVSATDVGMDDQGRAIAVWNPLAGSGGKVLRANRYTPDSGWLEEPEDVKPDDTTDVNGFRLDVGVSGDAFVIWEQDSDAEPRSDIWAARFSEGAWVAPERIDTYDGDDKNAPDIALDEAGTGYAVWSQIDEAFANIYVAEYAPGSGWGDPTLIEPPNDDPQEDGDAILPRVDVNRTGNVFVVWGQTFGRWPSIWSNRRDPEASWTAATAEVIEGFPGAANAPVIAVDEARHAHALWRHNSEGTLNVRTNRFE